ncbi:MAG: hypothetical protein LBI81_03505 [Puniceicoccales bacterium]|jgi:hypothetical protein|nr:hypothetical protein [Puniceicoccales bacterium]
MVKFLKKIFSLLLILMGIAVCVVLSPAFQKKIVIRHLDKYYSEVYLDKISVWPMTAKIRNLSVTTNNTTLMIEKCKIKWSLWNLIFFKQLKIKDVAMDVFIIYQPPTNDQRISAGEIYKDLRSKIIAAFHAARFMKNPQLPLKTTINHIAINGLADISEFVTIDLTVDGSGFAPLGTAILDVKSTIHLGEGINVDQQSLKIDCNGQMKIFQSDEGLLSDMDSSYNLKMFTDSDQLAKTFHIGAFAKITESKNFYHMDVVDDKNENVICNADIKYDNGQKKLFIECTENFDTSLLPSVSEKHNFPKFETAIKLAGEFDPDQGMLKSSGKIAIASNLIRELFPALKFPAVNFDIFLSAEQTFKMSNGVLTLESFSGTCVDADDSFKILCSSVDPLVIWEKPSGFIIEDNIFNGNKNLLELEIEHSDPEIILGNFPFKVDALIAGKFMVFSKAGTICVRSQKDPLVLKNCTISKNSKKYLNNVDISCYANFEFGEKTRVAFNGTLNTPEGNEICNGSINFASSKTKENFADCNLLLQLDQLHAVSLFPRDLPVKSGTCLGAVHLAQNNGVTDGEVNLKFTMLTLENDAIPINGESKIIFSCASDTLQASATLNAEGKHPTSAAATIDGTVNVNSGQINAKIDIKGDSLSLSEAADILKIPVGVFSRENARLISSTQDLFSVNKKSERGFNLLGKAQSGYLKKINGQLTVELGKVFLGDFFRVDKLECYCSVTDSNVDLREISCFVAESPLKIEAKLEYLKHGSKQPYAFSLDGTFSMRDMEKICQLIDPSRPAVISGTGDISLQLMSEGDNIDETLESAQGSLNIECEHGVLRVSHLFPHIYQTVAGTIGTTSLLLGNGNSKIYYTGVLVNGLREIKYDNMKIRINRGQDLHISLDEFNVNGPKLRANANAKITCANVKYKHFHNYPIIAGIEIEATDELGDAMNELGLTTQRLNNTKFVRMPKFVIRGTVGSPDYSDLTKILYKLLQNNIYQNNTYDAEWKNF